VPGPGEVASVQIIHAAQLAWSPLSPHRLNGKEAKQLLAGREGSPDNYRLVMIRESGVVAITPRHRHSFDQLRMTLAGRTNYGPKRWIEAGEIAYFPEGTHYGPEESEGDRLGFTFQFGGASGCGFMSERQSNAGVEALKAFGRFERGIFYRDDLAPGQRKAQDSYEAIWEHVNGRPLDYPKPRYDEPVLMRPANFAWQNLPGQNGVAAKSLGVFTERRLEIAMMRVEAGASAMLGPRPGTQLVCVLSGTGRTGAESLQLHSTFEVATGTVEQITAVEPLELLVVGLPVFSA
jgi:hypothetical protein